MKANDALIFSRLSLLRVAAAAGLGAMAPSRIGSLQLTTAKGRLIRVSHWRTHGCRSGTILSSHGNLSSLWKYMRLLWRLLFTAAGVLMSGVLAQAII
jgi:hypothetical protein